MRFSIICRISILEEHLYCIYKCKQVYAYFMRACMVSIYSIQFTWPFWPPPVFLTGWRSVYQPRRPSLRLSSWWPDIPCSSGLKIAFLPTTPSISILVLLVLCILFIQCVLFFFPLIIITFNVLHLRFIICNRAVQFSVSLLSLSVANLIATS